MKWRGTVAAFLLLVSSSLLAQGGRTPSDVVDAFHKALRNLDTAGALSLLDRGLVVYEFGMVDPTVEAYGLRHMPHDMDLAEGDVVEARDAPHRRRGQRSLGAEHLPGDGQDGRQHTDRPHHPRDGDLAPQRRELSHRAHPLVDERHFFPGADTEAEAARGAGARDALTARLFPHPTTGWARIHRLSVVYATISTSMGTWLWIALAGEQVQGHHVREHHGNHMPDDDEDHRAVPEHVGADDGEIDLVARRAEEIPALSEGVRRERDDELPGRQQQREVMREVIGHRDRHQRQDERAARLPRRHRAAGEAQHRQLDAQKAARKTSGKKASTAV